MNLYNTWHHKVNSCKFAIPSSVKNNKPTSLCLYFWITVANLAFLPIWATVVAISSIVAIAVIYNITIGTLVVLFDVVSYMAFGKFYLSWAHFWKINDYSVAIIILMVWNVAALVISALRVKDGQMKLAPEWVMSFFKKYFKSQTRPTKVEKPSGLVVSWIKAKKSKVCPIVTFDRPEE